METEASPDRRRWLWLGVVLAAAYSARLTTAKPNVDNPLTA